MGTSLHPLIPVIDGLITLALVGVAVARDIRIRGRPHAAYVYSGRFIALGTLARTTLHRTDAWSAVTDGLRTLAH